MIANLRFEILCVWFQSYRGLLGRRKNNPEKKNESWFIITMMVVILVFSLCLKRGWWGSLTPFIEVECKANHEATLLHDLCLDYRYREAIVNRAEVVCKKASLSNWWSSKGCTIMLARYKMMHNVSFSFVLILISYLYFVKVKINCREPKDWLI